MTKRYGWLVLVALVGFLAACGEQENTGKKTAIPGRQVVKVTQNAYSTLEMYVQQQRETYQNKVTAQLERLTRRIEKLQARTEKLEAQLKSKLRGLIGSLKSKRDAASLKLEKMKAETDQNWEMLKGELDSALDDMERDYDKVLDALP
jgi:DNA anti-recombination protein RmuC